MKSYSFSTKLKLGLILAAVVLAVISLTYTNKLVDQLREREQAVIQLWASAVEQIPKASQQSENPFQTEFIELLELLKTGDVQDPIVREQYLGAIRWAQGMPPSANLSFILDDILRTDLSEIPAIIADADDVPQYSHNLGVDAEFIGLSARDSAKVISRLEQMRSRYDPILMEGATQKVYYDDSRLIKQLRLFPFAQLLFGSLFLLVGYFGFSYVRRSEQSNLWVGMAKEAAHQLGTPISSVMGWIALLRNPDFSREETNSALDELEEDARRLSRVANRFSDIGSMPKLEEHSVASVVGQTASYMSRRLPKNEGRVTLDVDIPDEHHSPINTELFEWVIENLIKNALDAMENNGGSISIDGRRVDSKIQIDITDTGKGIDRRNWKNVFRPGFSTKQRGWGLGLSLAKRIVEDYHGGSLVLFKSRPGEGTTFRIELPAVAS